MLAWRLLVRSRVVRDVIVVVLVALTETISRRPRRRR